MQESGNRSPSHHAIGLADSQHVMADTTKDFGGS
jgi:hypothetical protein